MGLGALGAIANIGERLFDGFFGASTPKPRRPNSSPQSRPSNDNDDASRARAAERKLRGEELQAEEAARLYEAWQEQRRKRGRDRD
jgi:hypothetical protein